MNEGKAKTLVVASVGAAAVLSSLEHVAKAELPPLSTYVGATIAGVGLLFLAELSPDVAGGLALLLLTGAVLRNGSAAARTVRDSLD